MTRHTREETDMSKVPTDFRRATMLVNEMETPLQIYRDILGMEVYYDDEITMTGDMLPAGEPGNKVRLVILKANDPYIGMLGILQYLDPPLPERDDYPERLGLGDTVFVLNVEDAEAVHRKLPDVPGVRIQSEPHVIEYPKPGGGVFRLLGMSFFDPNGYFIEANQWLSR